MKAWATDTLPGVLQSFGQGVVEIGQAISRWSRTLGEFIRNGGETLRQIANDLPDLARNIRAASQPAAPPGWRLRLLPVGDSITEGVNSSSGNGYREALEGLEVGKGFPVDYVGSHRSGSMPQSRNEGWSSQEIGYIEDKTMANLKEYSPNVVTLLAGTNDIGHGKEAGAASRLMSFVEKIRAAVPDALVLVGALLPDESAATTAAHKRFNEQVQALLKPRDLAGVRFVSFDDLDPRAEMNGLHPNDAGYAKMATKWSAAIDYLLREGRVAQRAEISGDTGELGSCEDKNAWYPQGTITLGPGPSSSDRVSLSDINGDGRDDYLVIHKDGSVQAYVNGGGSPNNWVWYDYGIVAGGVGAPGREIMFADINGDGRDDYLVVSDQGKVNLWLNGGGKPNDWIWLDQGKIADGVGKTIRGPEPDGPGGPVKINPYSLQFADINGDGRDDYIVSEKDSGAGEAWLMIGDPFHPTLYPQGTVAFGAGSRGSAPQYANIDCAGRADYLRINTATNGVTAYRNNGAAPGGGYSWTELKDFATGDGNGMGTIIFADINGDGRDDYVNLTEGGALVNVYLRG